jgi:hypothetical protein
LPPVSPPFAKPKFEEISLSDTPTAAIAVAPETLTVTWMVAGSIVVELLILIVFLVRAAWWLSGRFTSIDGNFAATTKEITQIKSDVSNDIAGRRAVAEAREDIARIKATLAEFRERVDRLESHEDRRKSA